MVSLLQIVSLALVDAINPCAMAVMVIVLMTLLLKDPTKRGRVLMGGFMFTLAVFILYLGYGLLMTQVFKTVIPATGEISYWVSRGFGVFALVLGVLNLRDYLNYKPGSFATEMPLSMRSPMKRWIGKINSPSGAFVIGLLVTVFLLPCTIGPYIIASGELAHEPLLVVLSWLLLYNLVFVIPMIAITLIVYFGFSTVEHVSGWKDAHIRYLHLGEAVLLIVVGLLMVLGII